MAPVAISPERQHMDPLVAKRVIDGEIVDNRRGSTESSRRSSESRRRSIDQSVRLNDGNSIPQIALGVYKAPNGQETEDAVTAALDAGYRHIDSAARYANEEACGRAIRRWMEETGTPREEIFITSKLWDADHGYEATFNALCDSLSKFGLDYLDLYLIHSPSDDEQKRHDSWRALETAQKLGKVRSIGVSNFGVQHLDSLIKQATVVPAVNQIEIHPFLQRDDLVAKCQEHGIKIEAYSPLARGNKLQDPTIVAIAEKYGKTPAQVLLRWSAARGNIVLPKSMTAHRIESNAQIFDFELEDEDVKKIDALEEGYVTGSLHKADD